MTIVKLYENNGLFKWLEFDEKYYTFEEIYNFAFKKVLDIPFEYVKAEILTSDNYKVIIRQ